MFPKQQAIKLRARGLKGQGDDEAEAPGWAAIAAMVKGEHKGRLNDREPDGTVLVQFAVEGENVDFAEFIVDIMNRLKEQYIKEGKQQALNDMEAVFEYAREKAIDIITNPEDHREDM